MSRELLTSWAEYQSALDHLLALAQREIRIYDPDMVMLGLETGTRLDQLKRVLHGRRPDCIQIALRDCAPLKRHGARLMRLLADHTHGMTIQQTPEHLAHLRDSMVLIDGCHGLVRFDRDHPRAKLLTGESEELLPYQRRFEEIWAEGGSPLSITTLGL